MDVKRSRVITKELLEWYIEQSLEDHERLSSLLNDFNLSSSQRERLEGGLMVLLDEIVGIRDLLDIGVEKIEIEEKMEE